MSRSQPNTNEPNPATKFYEWSGGNGGLHFYDKEDKKQVEVALPFTFLLLDQLATVKGWHDPSESGIYANEVRDTRSEPFVVKSFKGGIIAEGIYKQVKDKIKAEGGKFVTNLYIAYKEGTLKLGSLQFKGAALQEWMEFVKNNKNAIYDKAIVVEGFKEGKKGSVSYKVPTFRLKEITPETNEEAKKVDEVLQAYLTGYFKRTKVEQAVPHAEPATATTAHYDGPSTPKGDDFDSDSDIPFAPNYL